ncbi:MAG: queuosine precursor transporter [Planctomycetes bacterium]|nr:queuosine precursor transporter [Planctomycetota bacterium]
MTKRDQERIEVPAFARGEDLRETLYHVEVSWTDRIYIVLVCVFTTLLVLTNVIGTKLFDLPLPFRLFGSETLTLTTGIVTYPITFLITDIVSEIYGKKRADVMVWLGFAMSFLMLGIVQMSIHVPPSAYWGVSPWIGLDLLDLSSATAMQDAWHASLGIGSWLVIGSMCAYLAAQLCDNFMFHFWRRLTHGRHLWLRNNGSTVISQLVDTFIVNSFLFYGAFRWDLVKGLQIMVGIYLVKVVIALLDTPFCYLFIGIIRSFLRRRGAFVA